MNSVKIGSFFKKYAMVIALIAVFLLFGALTDGKIFLPQNVNNLISQNAYVFILATGMFMCMLIKGNIDLSVGSILTLVSSFGVVVFNATNSILLTLVFTLVAGAVCGSVNGLLIGRAKMPAFIVTLGTIWDAVNDPLIGLWTANHTFKNGEKMNVNEAIKEWKANRNQK